MSLLLEALKKAEKAKEEAQRRAKGGDTAAQPDPDATVVEPGRHVRTRDELPDISQPLEILSEDLRPAQPAKPELSLMDETPVRAEAAAPSRNDPPRREPPRAAPAAGADTARAERASAQKVFEAKFKEPNPRLPFYITMGALALFGIGTGIYFWLQLRPAPSLVNTNPGRPADEKPVDVAAAPAPANPGAPGTAPASTNLPGLPGVTATPAPAATPPATPAPGATPAATVPATGAPSAAPARPESAPQQTARAKPPAAEEREVTVRRSAAEIHPQVASGYAAFQAGDEAKARNDYQLALRDDPGNRDALLGLAALEVRARRFDLADAHYQRLLQADPRDAYAQAGSLALRGGQLEPVQIESRIKALLAGDREANVLYFTLGNQYAQQGRWAEAQQAFFKAFAADPENPDFAFNLAVSLDQLRQPQLALEYYRRALTLSEKRGASFAAESARTRVQQLSR
jgi:Tfp pilus assembly protein PilF